VSTVDVQTTPLNVSGIPRLRSRARAAMLGDMSTRVFLCDDAPDYRTLVRAVLQPLGADIVGEADDGRTCIEQVAEADPEIVLLDLKMPGMTGLAALPRLTELVPDARIVVLSTAPASEYEQRTLDLGAVAYVQKPRDIFTLPDALRAALCA
jgi:DNA-binding NarL/FixJ family response regulator